MPDARVADIARRHGVSRSLIYTWRREARQVLAGDVVGSALSELAPVVLSSVSSEPRSSCRRRPRSPNSRPPSRHRTEPRPRLQPSRRRSPSTASESNPHSTSTGSAGRSPRGKPSRASAMRTCGTQPREGPAEDDIALQRRASGPGPPSDGGRATPALEELHTVLGDVLARLLLRVTIDGVGGADARNDPSRSDARVLVLGEVAAVPAGPADDRREQQRLKLIRGDVVELHPEDAELLRRFVRIV